MKDAIGNVLSIGDRVAFISSSIYKNLKFGTVIGFTPCFIKIEQDNNKDVSNRNSNQVIKYLKDDTEGV